MARRTLVYAALLVALVAAVVASLALGAVRIPFGEVLDILFGGGSDGPNQEIVETLRLPRTVEALVVGAALGIAGAILQGALANPLASPDVIVAVPHANEDDIPSLTEYLRNNPAWQSTPAVRNGRIHISIDNSLLQAGTDVARTIRKVRRVYLQN